MDKEFSFELNDHTLDSLRYAIQNDLKQGVQMTTKCIYQSGLEQVFELKKYMFKSNYYKRKRGKKYKRYIVPSNIQECYFEGVYKCQ